MPAEAADLSVAYDAELIEGTDADFIDTRSSVDCSLYEGQSAVGGAVPDGLRWVGGLGDASVSTCSCAPSSGGERPPESIASWAAGERMSLSFAGSWGRFP